MLESCLMASQGCPPGSGVGFHSEYASIRASEGLHYVLPSHGLNQELAKTLSLNSNLHQKDEWRPTGGLLDPNLCLKIDSTPKRPALLDFQESNQDSVRLSIGIAERCALQEKIMELLTSGSIHEEDILELSKFYHLMEPQSVTSELLQPDLIYLSNELYVSEPCLGLPGDMNTCPEKICHPEVQLQYNNGAALSDIISTVSELYSPKSTNKSSKLTMLVPNFEWRKKSRSKTEVAKPVTESVASSKSQDKVIEKASLRRKANTRTGKERDIYGNSYLHACESLLSVIVGRNQPGKTTLLSLKKSGPELPQFLTQCSATIAGTGIAVVLSVICRAACGMLPFSASKVLSTGLGLGLVWLSWAVNKLRDTVITISKASPKSGEKDEEMINNLDRNVKDIYFRAATLMTLAVLCVA